MSDFLKNQLISEKFKKAKNSKILNEKENKLREINEAKLKLYESDYKIIKCIEYSLVGLDLPYNLFELQTKRQNLRDIINQLENSEN